MTPLLDTLGRLHPVVLHLPIGVLIGLGVWELWRAVRRRPPPLGHAAVFFAWIGVLSSGAAIATGLLHEREFDADPTINLHKWLGIAAGVASLLTACVASAVAAGERRESHGDARGARRGSGVVRVYRAVLFLTLALLIPAGHFGGDITHGPGYLIEPLLRASAPASDPADPAAPSRDDPGGASAADPRVLASLQARAFEVLASRCESCHGPARTRGGLRVTSLNELLIGGRDGPAITPGDPAASRIVVRMRLPIDDGDHMPPSNRPQPEESEIVSIEDWIRAMGTISANPPAGGAISTSPASTSQGESSVQRSGPGQSVASVHAAQLSPPQPAEPRAIVALRDRLFHVQPIAQDSPLLWIDLSGPRTDDAVARQLLAPLLEQAAQVSLARSRITDDSAALLASMPRLERLDLSGTSITDAGLAPLAGHASLSTLVLAGTSVGDAAVETLASMPALRRVYLWDTAVTPDAIDWLALAHPELVVDLGRPEVQPLETEPEVVLGGALAPPGPPINTTCPVTGSPVDPRYSLVHQGRVVGFCCPNCPATFQADPARFASNLPPPE